MLIEDFAERTSLCGFCLKLRHVIMRSRYAPGEQLGVLTGPYFVKSSMIGGCNVYSVVSCNLKTIVVFSRLF